MAVRHLKIGVDLDNTIVCYSSVFSGLARKLKIQYPSDESAKRAVRDVLRRRRGGELEWTKLQAEAYGPGMTNAQPYPGVRHAITNWINSGHSVVIISHRTRFPAFGKPHDLHACARQWIDCWMSGLPVKVFLEVTRWMKLRRIESENCDIFVDDLFDLLNDETFPKGVKKVWFLPDLPSASAGKPLRMKRVCSWADISRHIQNVSSLQKPSKTKPSLPRRNGPFKGPVGDMFSALVYRSLNLRVTEWKPLNGGINNQVAKLMTTRGIVLIGKIYKRSKEDSRDRLIHETRYLRLLEKAGIDCVPRVLAVDEKIGVAIHTELAGKPWPENVPVPTSIWRQFSLFLERVQMAASLPESAMIPFAAEAAMSLQEHLGWVQQRRDLWRFRALDGKLPPATEDLVLQDLEKAYEKVVCSTLAHSQFRCRIASDQLILTPSDFGLHNVLVTPEGRLNFVDFEYAGWDDPIKTDVDFALQPRYHAGRPQHLDCLKCKVDNNDSRTQAIRDLLSLKWRYIILAAGTEGWHCPALF